MRHLANLNAKFYNLIMVDPEDLFGNQNFKSSGSPTFIGRKILRIKDLEGIISSKLGRQIKFIRTLDRYVIFDVKNDIRILADVRGHNERTPDEWSQWISWVIERNLNT